MGVFWFQSFFIFFFFFKQAIEVHLCCFTATEQMQYVIFDEPCQDIRLSKMTSSVLLKKILTSFSRPNFKPQLPDISNN